MFTRLSIVMIVAYATLCFLLSWCNIGITDWQFWAILVVVSVIDFVSADKAYKRRDEEE